VENTDHKEADDLEFC